MLPGRNDAEMGPANSLLAVAYYCEYNERFDLILMHFGRQATGGIRNPRPQWLRYDVVCNWWRFFVFLLIFKKKKENFFIRPQ